MKINNIVNNATRNFSRFGLKIKKHSPEIMVTAGVVGVVTSAVMACKATMKVDDILTESKEKMEKVRDAQEKLEAGTELTCDDGSAYTLDDVKKDTTIVYVQTGLAFAKIYWPAVSLGILSITSIITGHRILRKRNVAITAAYATIDKSFKEYRARVAERFGRDVENEIRYNIKKEEIEETVIDEKTGKEKTVKKEVSIVDPNAAYSAYAKIFEDGCTGWTKNPEYNLMFLKKQQAFANDLLKSRGHLFLNEVYDMLNIPRTKAGNIVGWLYDEKNPTGDNYVDFGIYDLDKPRNRAFVNGYEQNILLDFNVDGDILDLM